ncbi:MAG: hypothetical protein WBE32_23620, partial [Pseudolabrys sp.]
MFSLIALDPRIGGRRPHTCGTDGGNNYKQIFLRVGSYDRNMNQPLRSFLADLYRTAVGAAHP